MFIKIKRKEALLKYPQFPTRHYDDVTDEEIFFYPPSFKNYILTLHSKSFKGHIRSAGIEITKLTKHFSWETLIFLGDTELGWLHQQNDYKPVEQAQQYFTSHNVGKSFNGALHVDFTELPLFIIHLGWLIRCNASLPYIYFSDIGQNIIGHICKYGNVHISALNKSADKTLKLAIAKTKFEYLKGNNCYNQFGTTSAIAGRSIKV